MLRARDKFNTRKRLTVTGGLLVALLLSAVIPGAVIAGGEAELLDEQANLYKGTRFSLGTGLGIVRFDTKVKVTDKQAARPVLGRQFFLDLEGNLDLPEISNVKTFYGAYRFNPKHAILFGYFAINRQSTLVDFEGEYANGSIVVKADLNVLDKSRFYNVNYGYSLHKDDRSEITFVAGLNGLDLRLLVDASGDILIDNTIRVSGYELAESSILVPLPLLGLNFGFSFTPRWSLGTRISLVTGSARGVTATITQTSVNSMYRLSNHVGLLLGITYFSATASLDEPEKRTEVSYAYNGAFLGMHFRF